MHNIGFQFDASVVPIHVSAIEHCCWFQNSKSIDLDVMDSDVSKLDFIKDGQVVKFYNSVTYHHNCFGNSKAH